MSAVEHVGDDEGNDQTEAHVAGQGDHEHGEQPRAAAQPVAPVERDHQDDHLREHDQGADHRDAQQAMPVQKGVHRRVSHASAVRGPSPVAGPSHEDSVAKSHAADADAGICCRSHTPRL